MTHEGGDSAPARAGRRSRQTKKGKGGVIAFLLVSAIPIGAITWYVMQPAETQDRVAAIFEGSGGRAAKAGICLAVMVALARIALPAFHVTSGALRGVLARFREKNTAIRVLLFPIHFVVWLLWFVVQLLFALDAVMILATGALFLILAIRIVDPSVLADVLPEILS